MSSVKYSIVIPTCSRQDTLAECLDRLAPGVQQLGADKYEVIVTDDAVEHTAQKMMSERYPWARWVEGKHKGPATNRNSGASHALGEWLVFTDDDCLPEPNWLSSFDEKIETDKEIQNEQVQALEGAILPKGDFTLELTECPYNPAGGYFWSANIAIRKSLFESIGGFDTSYPLPDHEDQDLQLRVLEKTKIAFVGDALVWHPVRFLTLSEAIAKIDNRCASWTYHGIKHYHNYGLWNYLKMVRAWSGYWLREFWRTISIGYFRAATVSMLTVLFGPYLICSNLKKLRKLKT